MIMNLGVLDKIMFDNKQFLSFDERNMIFFNENQRLGIIHFAWVIAMYMLL